MRRKKVTLADLSKQLGLSVQTVSKALTGKPGMSEETRSEVCRLARELGYWTKDQRNALTYERISPYPVVRRRFVLLHNEQSVNFNRLLLAGLHDRFTEFGHTVEPLLLPPELKPKAFDGWADKVGLPYAEGVFIAPPDGWRRTGGTAAGAGDAARSVELSTARVQSGFRYLGRARGGPSIRAASIARRTPRHFIRGRRSFSARVSLTLVGFSGGDGRRGAYH